MSDDKDLASAPSNLEQSRHNSFTVAPAFNSYPSNTNLSNLVNEINFIDLDALFAGTLPYDI
jgi:hypothetical protein